TVFFFSSRRRHTRFSRDWSSDVCSSDLKHGLLYLLTDRSMFRWIPGKRTTPEDDQELQRVGRRLRLAFEELGPTFIKLGQVLVEIGRASCRERRYLAGDASMLCEKK